MAAAATPPTPAQNGPPPGNARAAASPRPAGEPRFAALLTQGDAPATPARMAAGQVPPVVEATPGTTPAPQEAAPAVLAARLAGQDTALKAATAAADLTGKAPTATAAEAPGGGADPAAIAGLAAAVAAIPGGAKAAKATSRSGLPGAADGSDATTTDPASIATPAPGMLAVPPPLPPPVTQPATAPARAPGQAIEGGGATQGGGRTRPERLPAAADAAPLAAPMPRAGEPTQAAEQPIATAAPQPAEATPPPPAQAPPAPPEATQAAAPARQAPHTSPAHQVAPVVVAVALGQGGGSSLVVRLTPVELGQVEVRIERPADGSAAQVKVVAERPETLALLQRDAPELGRALQQAGIAQDNCRLSFSLGGQDQGNGAGSGGRGAGQGPGNQGWGGRQARFSTEEVPPPRQATSLLDMSI